MRLSMLRSAELRADVAERARRVRADSLNRRQANNDDQREHNGVFHRGRAVFRNDKPLDAVGKLNQDELLTWNC